MRTITTLILLLLLQITVKAQNVYYTYDASGNRVHRSLTPTPIAPPSNNGSDSSTAIVNDIERIISADSILTSTLSDSAGVIANANSIAVLTEGDIKVFPNPVQDKLNVQFNGTASPVGYSLQIYDGAAKLFYKTGSMQALTEVDMQQAKTGVYFLVIQTKDGKRLYWKVVKE